MSADFAGKVALITGGGTSIGEASARQIIAQKMPVMPPILGIDLGRVGLAPNE